MYRRKIEDLGRIHRQNLAAARDAVRNGEASLRAWTHIVGCDVCRRKIERSVRNNRGTSYGDSVDEFLNRIKPVGD